LAEYLTQLEQSVASTNNENKDLRIQNGALVEEYARLMAFVKEVLRHPGFAPFLENGSDLRWPDISTITQPTPFTYQPCPQSEQDGLV
jgi:hypothetical protein